MNPLLLAGALPALTICPGAWIAFGLPLDALGWKVRLALAVTLSPAVLGAQYLILKLLGVPFGLGAWLLLLVNLLALLLMARTRPRQPALSRSSGAIAGLLTVLGLALLIILPWLLIPNLRTFAWHALMHTSIIYRVADSPGLPGDPELAGVALAYPWLGHVYWATLGVIANVAPTVLYPISNLIWLALTAYLIYAIARHGLGLRPPAAIFGVVFTYLATQAVPYAVRVVLNDWYYAMDYFGFRLMPLVGKYQGFETMPFGFAMLLAIILLAVLSLRTPVRLGAFGVAEACLLVGLTMVYPILMVGGFVVVGWQFLALLPPLRLRVPRYSLRDLGWWVVALAVASVLALLTFIFYFQGTTGSSPLAWAGVKTRFFQTIFALLPFFLLALPSAWRGLRTRDGAILCLLASAAVACVLHFFMRFGDNEYKFVLVATLLLGPLCAATVDDWLGAQPRRVWTATAAAFVLFAVLDLAWVFRLGGFVPSSLAYAFPLNETQFALSLGPDLPDAAWVQAIRDQSPADSVVVAENTPFFLPPFVRRELFASADADGRKSAGYSMDNADHLIAQRRYPRALVEGRHQVVASLYTACDEPAIRQALAALAQVQRPLAIHFAAGPSCALDFLRGQQIGTSLYTGQAGTVWLINAPDLRRLDLSPTPAPPTPPATGGAPAQWPLLAG